MKKILIFLVFILNLFITTAFWWYFSGDLILSGGGNSTLLAISRLAGLWATQLALYQLLLIGRVKWVEAQFGLDKLSKIHKWNGYTILGFVILHIVLVTKAYAGFSQLDLITQFFNLNTQLEDVFKAFLATLILFGTIALSITIVRRNLKYEYWYYVHLLNYLTFLLFVGHQLNLGMSTESFPFQIYWMATYVVTAGLIGWFRFLIPTYHFWKHDFRIEKIEQLNNAVNIYITGNDLSSLKRESGQFFILRFLQKGFWYEAHPFSMSWSEVQPNLRVTIKNLGDFTSKVSNLKPGTKVLIDGPHGVFTKKQINSNKLLLIAGGIGITPIRSLMEDLSGKSDTILLYSTKTRADALLSDEIDLYATRPNTQIKYILSEEPAQTLGDALGGMLDQAMLARLVPDIQERQVFLCGPPRMMDAIRSALVKLGLPKNKIHFERFAL